MNSAKELQKQHEKSVCDILFRSLNLNAEFERYGNDINEPDCIYKLDQQLLGIEVATAYPKDEYARRRWTLTRGEREFPKQGYEWLFDKPIYLDKLMSERIQNEINDKCSKDYFGVDEIRLCIEEDNPLSDEDSVKNCIRSLKIPEKHCFRYIYLLYLAPTREGGDYKSFKIYSKE